MLHKIKADVELKEQSKRGKEAEERHETEEGLLRKSLEDTRKREEEQDKTIKRLRKENCKLMEENLRNEGIWTRKFEDLIERVLSLGNDVEMLKKERKKEASKTHVQGSTNFIILAVLTLVLKGEWHFRQIVLSVLVVLWGLRLGLFLLFSGDWGEDRRFDEMRNNLGKLAVFWTFQAVWVWTVSLPVTVVNASDKNPFLQPEDMGCVFRAITSSYYRGALGALLVYDITRRATYESVRKWLRELREYGNQDMVVILVGNKCDLKESRQVEEEEGRVVAEEEGLCFMETSALQNLNVEEAFLEMITKIHDVTIHKSLEAKRNDTLSMRMNLSNGKEISLDDEVTATKHQSNYCCSR
ncbi:ras-related protein RABA6b-like [Senna tora]|uniref:Ras-related protein RABA6b-like n=1 Tax=Senna tora TaxID=362788 RepID=A0A834WGV1_9FABA|nr:ras-related protein RABA6b-like [Senna tora]